MKKTICILAALALVLTAFAACGKPDRPTPAEATGTTAEPTTEDARPTAESLAGTYESGRCFIRVICTEDNVLRFEIEWGAGAMETARWQMTAVFDPDTGAAAYDDCVMTDCVYDTESGTEIAETVYENGTGSFTFKDGKLLWEDAQENVAEGMEFARAAE